MMGFTIPRIGLHSWNLPLSASFYTAPEAGTEPQTASAQPTSADLEPRLGVMAARVRRFLAKLAAARFPTHGGDLPMVFVE